MRRRLELTRRALRLRCPICGEGRLFAGWFRMHEHCAHCGFRFQREPGYFLGSIYFNYGVTSLVVVAVFFGLFLGFDVSPETLLWPLTAFCLLFPLWFFRYARALWLAMDASFDPLPPPRAGQLPPDSGSAASDPGNPRTPASR